MKAILLSLNTLATLTREQRDEVADDLMNLVDILRSDEVIEPEITGIDSFLRSLGLNPGPKV